MNLNQINRRMQKVERETNATHQKTIVCGRDCTLPDDYNPKIDKLNMHVVINPDDSWTSSDATLSWKGRKYSPKQFSDMATNGNNSGVAIYKTIYEPGPQGI